MFLDRAHAGRRLGAAMAEREWSVGGGAPDRGVVVLGLPRGGVVVAAGVARALGAPLDVLIVRKIGSPQQPELAIGAVADGAGIHRVIDRRIMESAGVSEAELEELIGVEVAEVRRRERVYRGDRIPVPLEGRTVVVVDDGIATGSTLAAGLASLRGRGVGRLVVGVPCAPRDALPRFERLAADVVCLESPTPFRAVGLCYEDFEQVGDAQVIGLLQAAGASPNDRPPAP